MKIANTLFVALLACLLLNIAFSAPGDDSELDKEAETEYRKFVNKERNGKYVAQRKAIFKETYRKIKEHNIKFQNKQSDYELGINEFADWTEEEWKSLSGTLGNFSSGLKEYNFRSRNKRQTAFSSYDWRTTGGLNPIMNQYYCGACWAFSTAATLESTWYKKTGKLYKLSEQQLINCDTKSFGCNGGYLTTAFPYAISNPLVPSSVYPYNQAKGLCNYDRTKGVAKFASAYYTTDENTIKIIISNYGTVSALMWASLNSFNYYKSGIYTDTACASYVGKYDHAVNIVGYGTSSTNIPYWIVRNTWGTTWGINGYALVQRATTSNCGVGAYVIFGFV